MTEESDKPKAPPYIHFTLHKTNRDTQDCIAHLSRALGCNANDVSVCGTKDKRAVTVQKVCFKRRGKNLLAVWKSANNIRHGRNTEKQAVQERGERGARIGDLEYSDKYLELGMLKGNHFAITLRYVHRIRPVVSSFDGHLLIRRQKCTVRSDLGRDRRPPCRNTVARVRQLLWHAAIRNIDCPYARHRPIHPSV